MLEGGLAPLLQLVDFVDKRKEILGRESLLENSLSCKVDGLSVRYTDEGAGQPILLLHGWGSSLDAFARIRREFSPAFRLVALDFPGFGGSDMPPEPWAVEDYALFTLRFLKEIGLEDPILIGHSFGGRVIMKLAGTGRLNPPKIILIDAAGVQPKKTIKQKVRQRSFKIVKGALTLPGLKGHTEGLLDKARRHYGSADYNSAPEVLRKTLVKVVNEDLSHLLPSIAAPTLLIYGEKDTATPVSDAKKIEQLILDAGLCVIEGAGHFSFVERPYQVHRILHSFLGG